MRKSTLLVTALIACGNMHAGILQNITDSAKAYVKQVAVRAQKVTGGQYVTPPPPPMLVLNLADSYNIYITTENTANPAIEVVAPPKGRKGEGLVLTLDVGKTWTITAKDKKSGKVAGEPVTFKRTSETSQQIIEFDVGRAPDFPSTFDAQGNQIHESESVWTGSASLKVKIWMRVSSLAQVKSTYKINM